MSSFTTSGSSPRTRPSAATTRRGRTTRPSTSSALRVAADAVLPELRDGRGTLLLTGGGYALHPSKKFASLSVGKAGLRAYVHMLHDQLAGTGVHATSVTITATIGSAPRFEPAEIAKAYLELDNQPEAEWQHELVY